jgi:sulfate adenylyltransferase subunit 1 (EFTu-like GTPase family)
VKTIVNATVESGRCTAGDLCVIMPTGIRVRITNIYFKDNETKACVWSKC